jgi:hypothetical protein
MEGKMQNISHIVICRPTSPPPPNELKDIGCGVMDSIDVSQDKDRWRCFVNVVMKLHVA